MQADKPTKEQAEAKRTWETPCVQSSEVFNKAALACCLNEFNEPIGSAGSGLPLCN